MEAPWHTRALPPAPAGSMQRLKLLFRDRRRKAAVLTSRLHGEQRKHTAYADMLQEVTALLVQHQSKNESAAISSKALRSRIDRQGRAMDAVRRQLNEAAAERQVAAKRAANQLTLVAEFVDDTLREMNRESKRWRAAATAAAATVTAKRERGGDNKSGVKQPPLHAAKRRRRTGGASDARASIGGADNPRVLVTTLFGLYDGGGGVSR
ncbi:hypothetical protein LCGC14_2604630 [marine sediment metagenome]|uniref:Uncharacterized protein n=1 Tax=marine sediment metagenome TaxID=412755 RepID=A0A0F9D0F5_9ZZZZ